MKTQDNILIYDDDCPMCRAYSGAFTRMGLLKKENRVPFHSIPDESFAGKMDPIKSKNEIPLINLQTGETLYGTEALIEILSQRWPFFRYFKTNPLLHFLSRRAYFFVSYNRKVIVPATPKPGSVDCSPSFSLPYRLSFILMAIGLGSVFYKMAFPHLAYQNQISIGILALGIQCIGFLFVQKEKIADYAGNIALLWFLQGFVLYLTRSVQSLFHSSFWVLYPGIFMLFCLAHFRRSNLLQTNMPIQALWLLNQLLWWALLFQLE